MTIRTALSDSISKRPATGKKRYSIDAKNAEAFFKGVREEFEAIGMKINLQKTQLLCISTAGMSTVESFIRVDGEKTTSSDKLKICGYTAISTVTDYIEKHIYNQKHVIGVFLDIQAAFNSIKPSKIKEALLLHGGDPLMLSGITVI